VLDLLSFAAVSAAIQAFGSGAASEAGKQAWDGLGAFARRVLGREVTAPAGRGERDELTDRLLAAVRDEPALAAELAVLVRTAPLRRTTAAAGSRNAAVGQPPATTRHFTDRQKVFKAIDAEADRTGFGARAVLLYAREGAGTTSVAVHYGAHRRRKRFPDGVLYGDLRGGSAATADAGRPGAVLGRFLAELGVPQGELPPSAEDRAALYRELVAERRLLAVVDHVRTAAEARLFHTDAPGVLTLYASHGRLPGLEARPIPVEPLSGRDSLKLAGKIAGDRATRANRSLLRRGVRRYAGSPLAITVFARQLAADPHAAAELLDSGAPTGSPGTADVTRDPEPVRPAGSEPGTEPGTDRDPAPASDAVREITELMQRELSAPAARLLRLLSLRPWPDVDGGAAAAAAELPEAEVGPLLAELAAAELLTSEDGQRYRLRPYARERAERAAAAEEGAAACSAAVRRMTARWLRLAVDADYRALPDRWRLGPLYREHRGRTVGPAEAGPALAELRAEARNLVEAVRAADAYGDPDTVVQLCESLWTLVLKDGREEELLPALRIGARTADRHVPGTRTAGRMHTQLAYALGALERFAEAEEAQRAAAEAERTAGHKRGHATALEALGVLRLRQWRYAEAAEPLHAARAVLDTIGTDEEGAADVPRARALLVYHLARVRRGLGEREAALAEFAEARRLFRELTPRDRFNEAKALTGVAGTRLDAGEPALAVGPLDEALAVLEEAGGAQPLAADIAALRERCAREAAG